MVAGEFIITIGNEPTLVLEENPERIQVIVINVSDEVIYVTRGMDASVGTGEIVKSGESYTFENAYTGVISAICESGGKDLKVFEL